MERNSRDGASTDHALRVLVRIDTRAGLASLEVRGCLTSGTHSTLSNILSHTGALGAAVSVNLLRAAHVDPEALEQLLSSADAAVGAGQDCPGPVEILVPPVLPVCRLGPEPAELVTDSAAGAQRALTNEEAAERAFLRADPRVLAEGNCFRPRKV